MWRFGHVVLIRGRKNERRRSGGGQGTEWEQVLEVVNLNGERTRRKDVRELSVYMNEQTDVWYSWILRFELVMGDETTERRIRTCTKKRESEQTYVKPNVLTPPHMCCQTVMGTAKRLVEK
jgi:hypothetical protein